jgi:hypothetical protein
VSVPWRVTGGFVYVILASEVKRVKIGRSERSAQHRLNEIVPQSPARLQLHSETWHEDHIGAEAEFHARFAHARELGEWFCADDADVAAWLTEREDLMGYYERFTAEFAALLHANSH